MSSSREFRISKRLALSRIVYTVARDRADVIAEKVLFYLLWCWLPMRCRIALENVWYWIFDVPVWEAPYYDRIIRARTKEEVHEDG